MDIYAMQIGFFSHEFFFRLFLFVAHPGRKR